jgi:hypothetical protein
MKIDLSESEILSESEKLPESVQPTLKIEESAKLNVPTSSFSSAKIEISDGDLEEKKSEPMPSIDL